jgi:hypothetical protein
MRQGHFRLISKPEFRVPLKTSDAQPTLTQNNLTLFDSKFLSKPRLSLLKISLSF